MDRFMYVAMTGAKQAMNRITTVSNNLANVSTTGFRADLDAFRAVPVLGGGMPTRAYAVAQTTGADFTPGSLQFTGRDLDASIDGDGWFTVQTSTGEAYTRDGGFEIDSAGLLKTRTGLTVLGQNGPITVPDNNNITIGADGTITATQRDQPQNTQQIGQLKLVNPPVSQIAKGSDGLFRRRDGAPANVDDGVVVAGDSLENSNVNSVSELVNMITTQRQYDMQVQMITTADTDARSAATLIQFNS